MSLRWLAGIALLVLSAICAKGSLRAVPSFFIASQGARLADADYVLQNGALTVEFRTREMVYHLPGRTVRIVYLDSRAAHAEGLEPLTGKVNYLVGSDRTRWRKDLDAYASLAFREMWPGIDVVYSIVDGRLKTELQLAPGADPDRARWRIDGADSIQLGKDGAVLAAAADQTLREDAPQVFEQDRVTFELRPVAGHFRLLPDRTVGIAVGEYDHANRLIFDPVVGYSTYVGGSGQSSANAIAVDSDGNAVIAGYTTSLDILNGAHSLGTPQRTVAFVAKVSAAGNQLLFCTYIGGSLDDRAYAVTLDRWNNIYIAGATSSRNFPVANAVQPRLSGGEDVFVAELSPTGNTLIFSTFLGGSASQVAYGIGLNRQGNIFVSGDTQSSDFPLVKPLQSKLGGGQDAFLVKLGVSGAGLLFSSYWGGTGDDHSAALSVDSAGAVIVAGSTQSANFPVANAFQSATGGNQDAFITKFNPALTGIVFSTYAGGAGGTPGLPEAAAGVAVDSANAVYVAGTTSSTNFPVTSGVFQPSPGGGMVDVFVMKLSPSGMLVYSTYLGGSSVDYAAAIAVDIAGNAHITGYTGSTDFPVVRPVQAELNGSYNLFLTKLNNTASALVYSTVMGGSGMDSASAIAVDRFATVFLAGQSDSTDFPTANAYQSAQRGSSSAVVARIPVGWKPVVVNTSATPPWALDAQLAPSATQTFPLAPANIPLIGDWTRKGHQCTGSFGAGTWWLDLNCDGSFDAGDRSFVFGQAGDIPIVGDWNGTGTLKAGVYRNGTFFLDLSGHLSGVPTGLADVSFAFGKPTDIPVAGDWNNTGITKVGVFRNGQWLLDWNGTHAITCTRLFGTTGDIPLTGDWDGSGTVKLGVYRKGIFILDYEGNLSYDPSRDMTIPFGQPGQFALIMH